MAIRTWLGGLWGDLTHTVNIDEHPEGGHALVRDLGLLSVVLFTITQAVGSGILTTPQEIAEGYSGSWAWVSFLKAGIVCFPAALCLARMARFTSRSGSTGSYACIVLGQFVGLLMFCDVALECIGGSAAVAVSQADHIKLILRLTANIHLSDKFTKTPDEVDWLVLGGTIAAFSIGWWLKGAAWRWRVRMSQASPKLQAKLTAIGVGQTGTVRRRLGLVSSLKYLTSLPGVRRAPRAFVAYSGTILGYALLFAGLAGTGKFLADLPSVNVLSVLVVGAVTGVLLLGVRETKWVTNILTVLKLLTILYIIYVFWGHFSWDNLLRPIPEGKAGTTGGAALAFFAFVGIDLATMTAGETKNAKVFVPLGMMIGLLAVTALYVAATFMLYGAVTPEQLAEPVAGGGQEKSAPMARALEILGHPQAAVGVAIASTIALLSVVLASMYSTTRLIHNIAQHGLLPPVFEHVSAKRKVPVAATVFVAGLVALLTALLSVKDLMHLCNIGTMTAFFTISLTVLVKTVRETKWRSRAAWSGALWVLIALAGMAGSLRLMAELPWSAFIRLIAVWTAVTVMFVCYSRHAARRHHESKRALAAAPPA